MRHVELQNSDNQRVTLLEIPDLPEAPRGIEWKDRYFFLVNLILSPRDLRYIYIYREGDLYHVPLEVVCE